MAKHSQQMAVLALKPSRIYLKKVVKGSYDENGDYVPGTFTWEDCGKCDVVPAGKANQIAIPDGQVETYSYTIYLPRCSREFKYGDRIKIVIMCCQEEELVVKGFHRYQLQCKLWA